MIETERLTIVTEAEEATAEQLCREANDFASGAVNTMERIVAGRLYREAITSRMKGTPIVLEPDLAWWLASRLVDRQRQSGFALLLSAAAFLVAFANFANFILNQ